MCWISSYQLCSVEHTEDNLCRAVVLWKFKFRSYILFITSKQISGFLFICLIWWHISVVLHRRSLTSQTGTQDHRGVQGFHCRATRRYVTWTSACVLMKLQKKQMKNSLNTVCSLQRCSLLTDVIYSKTAYLADTFSHYFETNLFRTVKLQAVAPRLANIQFEVILPLSTKYLLETLEPL